tara:strand:- start:725 stop:970 length:246 start_codon:yes stop_codon:yes gene_type:complete
VNETDELRASADIMKAVGALRKAEKLYDAHCEHLGRGKRGHLHWDDLPLEERIQWRKVALAMDEPAPEAPPPPGKPGGNGP